MFVNESSPLIISVMGTKVPPMELSFADGTFVLANESSLVWKFQLPTAAVVNFLDGAAVFTTVIDLVYGNSALLLLFIVSGIWQKKEKRGETLQEVSEKWEFCNAGKLVTLLMYSPFAGSLTQSTLFWLQGKNFIYSVNWSTSLWIDECFWFMFFGVVYALVAVCCCVPVISWEDITMSAATGSR